MNADQPRPIHNEAELTEAEKHKTLKKVVFSSFLGNFIEWFDYASYSYLATVIALVFFPGEDKMVSTMMTFGVFALAFLVRPLGAIFWGNMGDKKGRKWALSISILMMSGATFLIGCLPGYAVIGVGAPLLLLLMRMVQSFSASGEYAGAATFIAEYSPKNHRGFYCSMVPASTAVGLLVGSLFATWMFNTFGASSDFVVNWGWRIPFWLAGPLGYITHYIREHLEDSPVYAKMQAELAEKGMKSEDKPIRTLFKKHFRVLVISFGACVLNAVGFYAVLTYLPNYLEATLNYDPGQAFHHHHHRAGRLHRLHLPFRPHLRQVRSQEDAHHGCCRLRGLHYPCVLAAEHAGLLHHPRGRVGHVLDAHHQRRYPFQLPVRDVPDRRALLWLRSELQPG